VAEATARLALYKHDAGDPDWHTLLNGGFDDADARFMKASSDYAAQTDPNLPAPLDADFVGQKYIDEESTPPRTYTCTDATPAASVWELLNTTSVEAPGAGHGGNNILEDILADFEARVAAIEAADPTPPRGMIDGLTLSYETGGNVLGIAAGECADDSKTKFMERSAAWTKDRGTWAAGDGNPGISSSVWDADGADVIVGKWYHTFLMWESGFGHDVGFDEDVTGANLKTDHGATYVRRIGAWMADPNKLVTRFTQYGDYFEWYTPFEDHTGSGISGTAALVECSSPLDVYCLLSQNLHIFQNSTDVQVYVTSPQQENETTNRTAGRVAAVTVAYGEWAAAGTVLTMTDLLSQVRVRGNKSISQCDLLTLGYFDPRGKDL